MHLEHYEITRPGDKSTLYEFVSSGPNGDFRKAVVFTRTNLVNLYNLGFGDVKPDGRGIDDRVVTDNGDTQKVLATVANIVFDFTERFPDAMVFATGSTPARTRLYRRGITMHLTLMSDVFRIFGLADNAWHPFEKGYEYDAFYVARKTSNFSL